MDILSANLPVERPYMPSHSTSTMEIPSRYMVNWRYSELSWAHNRRLYASKNINWSSMIQTLEILEGKPPFDPIDRVHGQYVLILALAQYIGYPGLALLNTIQKSSPVNAYYSRKDITGN